MAEKRKEEAPAIPSQNLGEKKSDSDKFQSNSQVKTTEEELETSGRRESKKRRKCPAALDNFQEFEKNSNRNSFSFSFDTKISSGGTPESTPKFGSFNLAGELGLLNSSSTITQQQQQQQPEEEEELEEFDLLGFSEIGDEDKKKKKKKNLIPIVVKSTD